MSHRPLRSESMFTYRYFSLASRRAYGDFSNWRIPSSSIGALPYLSLTGSGSFLHSFLALLPLGNRQPMIIMIDQADARCRSLDRDLVLVSKR